jgi:hypothetical protein
MNKPRFTIETVNGVKMVRMESFAEIPREWKGREHQYLAFMKAYIAATAPDAIVEDKPSDGPISVLDKVSDLIH